MQSKYVAVATGLMLAALSHAQLQAHDDLTDPLTSMDESLTPRSVKVSVSDSNAYLLGVLSETIPNGPTYSTDVDVPAMWQLTSSGSFLSSPNLTYWDTTNLRNTWFFAGGDPSLQSPNFPAASAAFAPPYFGGNETYNHTPPGGSDQNTAYVMRGSSSFNYLTDSSGNNSTGQTFFQQYFSGTDYRFYITSKVANGTNTQLRTMRYLKSTGLWYYSNLYDTEVASNMQGPNSSCLKSYGTTTYYVVANTVLSSSVHTLKLHVIDSNGISGNTPTTYSFPLVDSSNNPVDFKALQVLGDTASGSNTVYVLGEYWDTTTTDIGAAVLRIAVTDGTLSWVWSQSLAGANTGADWSGGAPTYQIGPVDFVIDTSGSHVVIATTGDANTDPFGNPLWDVQAYVINSSGSQTGSTTYKSGSTADYAEGICTDGSSYAYLSVDHFTTDHNQYMLRMPMAGGTATTYSDSTYSPGVVPDGGITYWKNSGGNPHVFTAGVKDSTTIRVMEWTP